jgi:hypothetical protein
MPKYGGRRYGYVGPAGASAATTEPAPPARPDSWLPPPLYGALAQST